MAGTPREHVGDKGFWDGGTEGNDRNSETAGRTSGFPGTRKPSRVGIRTDIEFPEETPAPKTK
jgi:hypothetical protein